MNTRRLERSGTMTRGKRSLQSDEEQQPERKRPALSSVIVEALKVDNLQKICSSMEPILRRVVSEEVERALAKMGSARLTGRSSPKCIEGPSRSNLQLQFRSRFALPLFTGGRVEGDQGAAIHVVLVDADSGHVLTSGLESSVKLDVVVLEGDFNNEDDEGWTQEEFESHVVKEREGKRPLLTGDLQVVLKEGVGTLGDVTFTDNSSWIRSRKFRLGLMVAPGSCEGVHIREAKSEAFAVKDHRGELYRKHYPPALTDEVWRLEKIGKDGSFHKKLTAEGILTVQDFLRLAVRDYQKLRNILGSGMSNRMWEVLIEHAKTCVLSGKHYVYYPDQSRSVGVVFNNIYELGGLISGEQYFSADSLSDSQKVYMDTLLKKAYDNWSQVIEYDGRSLLSFQQYSRTSSTPRNEFAADLVDYHGALEDQPLPGHHLSSAPSEQSSMGHCLPVEGYSDDGLTSRYAPPSQIANSTSQFVTTAFNPHGHLMETSLESKCPMNAGGVGLALAPPLSSSSSSGFLFSPSSQVSNQNHFMDWHQSQDRGPDEFFSEEEIRMRSHEILENEEIQQMLRVWSMNGHVAAISGPEEGLASFPSSCLAPTPSVFSYGDDQTRPGKAVAGWLKIKAAMRWGFFVRRKAAERRAQLVELDDD